MSDFLTRLATRSSGAANFVRPRLASLFEPTAAGTSVFGAPAVGSRDGEPGIASADPRTAWDEREPRSVRATPVAAELSPPVDPTARSSLRPSAPRPGAGSATDASAPSSAELASPAVRPAPPQRAPRPPGRPPIDSSLERTELVAERDAQSAAARAMTGHSHDLAETAREPRAPHLHVPASPRTPRLREPDATVPRPPVSTPDLERVARHPPPMPPLAHATLPAAVGGVRPGAARSSSDAHAEPSIHVTIGRIEVRASSPPSAPSKGRTTPPIVGLDEYLKRRTGGGGGAG